MKSIIALLLFCQAPLLSPMKMAADTARTSYMREKQLAFSDGMEMSIDYGAELIPNAQVDVATWLIAGNHPVAVTAEVQTLYAHIQIQWQVMSAWSGAFDEDYNEGLAWKTAGDSAYNGGEYGLAASCYDKGVKSMMDAETDFMSWFSAYCGALSDIKRLRSLMQ